MEMYRDYDGLWMDIFLNCESFGQSRQHQQQSIVSVVLLLRFMNYANPFPSVKSLRLNTSI